MRSNVVVGSRKSLLAMTQTRLVVKALATLYPNVEFEIKPIVTTGDVNLTDSLQKIGGKGVFVKEIEHALTAGEIDFAVHSLKDVMPVLPADLMIGAFPKRESPYDCLISREAYGSLADLPQGARIGTNSLRREGQLRHQRPDLEIVPIRGNIDTRIKKIDTDHLDGVILAEAGLNRLAIELAGKYRTTLKETLVPATGQGALAIECRVADSEMREMLQQIHDPATADCVTVERNFLRELGGSCNFPIGGFATHTPAGMQLHGLIADPAGQHVLEATVVSDELTTLGQTVADQLLNADKFGIMEGSQQ